MLPLCFLPPGYAMKHRGRSTCKKQQKKTGKSKLLCSDGLTDMVPENQVRRILMSNETANTEDCVRVLLGAAPDAGGRDNVTVMVCDVS